MLKVKNGFLVYALLLLAALSLRVAIARFLPNDDPDDGRVYAQMARNLLEHHIYSHATEPPFEPSLIRLPGYPLFLAGVYSAFGLGDNTAVRIVQALFDAVTCGVVGLLAFYWEPDTDRKRAASIAALVLAALCPFTAIYTATILTETLTTLLAVVIGLTATLAFRSQTLTRASLWWATSGLVAGLAVLFRPDSALFAAAAGLTLVITTVFAPRNQTLREDGRYENVLRLSRASYLGAVFTLAFCAVLVPWTIRNWRVFHLFQPLAPAHAEMPGEFVPRGYLLWTRTWLTQEREIAPFLWALDTLPMTVESFPSSAFDSQQERQRVAALLDQYNHPETDQEATLPALQLQNEQTLSAERSPATSGEEGSDEDEEGESDDENAAGSEVQTVEMTPAIDAGFAQLARERIARSPVRYYVKLPLKRAVGLWFNTHSQYYPFEGELFPPEGVSHETSQQIWLPIFMALLWIYTFLAVVGGWFLWISKQFAARRWLLLTLIIIVLRIGFFSSLENPEPRYVVELFPFVAILGGIATVRVIESFISSKSSRSLRSQDGPGSQVS